MTTYGPCDMVAISQDLPDSSRQMPPADLPAATPDSRHLPPTVPAQPPQLSWRDMIFLEGGSAPFHAAPPNPGYGDMDPNAQPIHRGPLAPSLVPPW